ncbi:MAG: hypothetical protein M0Z71_12525 [Nitrospiraceae bacterium]|nr:hypothetical protein [Nitrospiraceae bacterium]
MDELRATLNALADKYGIDVVREETLLIVRRDTLKAAAAKVFAGTRHAMPLQEHTPETVAVKGRRN